MIIYPAARGALAGWPRAWRSAMRNPRPPKKGRKEKEQSMKKTSKSWALGGLVAAGALLLVQTASAALISVDFGPTMASVTTDQGWGALYRRPEECGECRRPDRHLGKFRRGECLELQKRCQRQRTVRCRRKCDHCGLLDHNCREYKPCLGLDRRRLVDGWLLL